MQLEVGASFAGYRIIRQLGSGGMGEVYLVQHPRLRRQEALKVLRPEISSDASFRERFIREADLTAGLRHPHIVAIHDRGEHHGQLWIAMDYIDGADLACQMEQRYPAGMPIGYVQPIITAVAAALDYAHQNGLLHRDIKPANIIVAGLDTEEPSVFLTDFGIARPLDDATGITTTNMTVGTVAYAAPEQLTGDEIDGRADQYALAATTYHLLTGVQLFPHPNPAVVIGCQLSSTPPRVGERRPDLAVVDGPLQTALAKDRDDRYPSCTTFARALAQSMQTIQSTSSAATMAAPLEYSLREPNSTSLPRAVPLTQHQPPKALPRDSQYEVEPESLARGHLNLGPAPARRHRTMILAAAGVAVAVVISLVILAATNQSGPVALPFTNLNEPSGVAVDSSGAVYVADPFNHRVLKLAAGSTAQEVLAFTDLVKPVGVAVDRSGAVYVVNEEWHARVVKLAGGSDNERAVLPSYWPGMSGLAVDKGGAVYVTDTGDSRVLKVPATCIDDQPGTSWICGHVNVVRGWLATLA